MSTATNPKKEGLRARKRRATENAIELAAVSLALEHGVAGVTVEAICDQADISRSTFFNYFSSRDYAIIGRAVDMPDLEQSFAILDTSPDDLSRGLFRLFFAAIGHTHVNPEVAAKRAQLIAEQAEAKSMSATVLLESGNRLIEVAYAWLLARPEQAKLDSPALEATLSASMLVAGFMVMREEIATAGDPAGAAAGADVMDLAAGEWVYDRIKESVRKVFA